MPARVAPRRRAFEGMNARVEGVRGQAQLKFSSRLQRPLGQHAPQA